MIIVMRTGAHKVVPILKPFKLAGREIHPEPTVVPAGKIEVHVRPEEAFSDGLQSLKPEKFQELMREIRPFVRAAGRKT